MPTATSTRALGLLLAALAAMLITVAVDIYGAITTASSTEALTDNALRSVQLVEDMRWEVHRLINREADEPEATIVARLDRDIDDYAPLADFENELDVWGRLRDELGRVRDELARGAHDAALARARHVGELVDELVAINVRQVSSIGAHMAAARRREVVIDVIVVLVVGAVLLRLGLAYQRALRRQAELTAQNLAMVQEQNRELEAFAGRAAHDLRAPLNPIRGFADLIASGGDSADELRRMGALIAKGVTRMNRVIDDMLALSRSGHAPPGTAPARAVAAAAVEELAADLRGAEVELDVADVAVACTDTALEQILLNLIGNAIKYRSPERPLRVAVRGAVAGARLRLDVVDNGTGMDAEAARHAFDPFFRGRRDVAGTGLGLAIVERIARAYGGGCTLDSTQAQGTTVTVLLPLAS